MRRVPQQVLAKKTDFINMKQSQRVIGLVENALVDQAFDAVLKTIVDDPVSLDGENETGHKTNMSNSDLNESAFEKTDGKKPTKSGNNANTTQTK